MAEENLNLLQQKARDWALKVVVLHNTQVPAPFEAKKQGLLKNAKTIKNTVESIIGKTSYLQPMDQLGFIPILIGAGVITTAVAAITKWSLDYSKFSSELSYQRELVNSGLSPQQAANVVNSRASNLSTITKIAVPVLLVGAAILFFTRKRGAQ